MESGKNVCQLCPPRYHCPKPGTVDPTLCIDNNGRKQYCPAGSSVSKDCPAGYFCPTQEVKEACVSGSDFCPSGSSAKTPCPESRACSIELKCADGSASSVWFEAAVSTTRVVDTKLSDTHAWPNCTSPSLSVKAQGPEVVSLQWEAFNCSDMLTAYNKSFLAEETFPSYKFRINMMNREERSSFSMDGGLETTSFSSLLRVPFGNSVTISLEMSVFLTNRQTKLCAVKAVQIKAPTFYMPFPPPLVKNVTAVLSIEPDSNVNVTWTMAGSTEEQGRLVGFTVFTDRKFGGKFLEIERKKVSQMMRQVSVQIVAGYSHQFRVQPENAVFYGNVSHPSHWLTAPCPSGEFVKPNDGCSPCGVGTYSQGNAMATGCIGCQTNEISSGGASKCTVCDPNEIANEAKSACIPCAVGSFRNDAMDACAPCADNTFNAGGGSDCQACDPNQIANEAKSACIPCPVGLFRNDAMDACAPCADNTFNAGGGSDCQACGPNQIANEAKSACIPCKSCAVGQGVVAFCRGNTDTICAPCVKNEISSGGSSECMVCDPNKIANEAKSACIPCPVGSFRNDTMDACAPCADNAFNAGGGSDCQACGPNQIANGAKSACIPCKSCAVGQGVVAFCRGNTDTICAPCVAGQFSPGGNNTCQYCGKGNVCPMGSFAPVVCPEGTYTDLPGQAECLECEGGYYCSGGNRTLCPSGSFCSQGSSAAAVCPKGTYTSVAGQVVCLECEAGHVCREGVRAECLEAGTYCAAGSYAVADCRAGFVCSTPASETKCSDGSHCLSQSVEELDCREGHFCTTPAASEEKCPIGTYCPVRSTLPVSLRKGFYAIDAAGNLTPSGGVDQRICDAGYSCDGGDRTLCGENELPNEARNACIPCKSCAVGEGVVAACSADADTQCVPCKDVEFSSGGISTCEPCTTNEISNQAKSACVPCAVGSFRVDDMDACAPCANNTFNAGGGSDCQPCSKNEIVNEAKSVCIPCKSCAVGEGFVAACSNGVDTECAPCKDGEFSSGGMSTCEPCKTNEISNTAKSACIPCKECPVGQGVISFCSGNTDALCSPCVAGQFSPGGNSTCQWCGEGEFCSEGAFAPRPCLKGHFCKSVSSEEPCPLGTYCPTGTVQPLACADGATCTVPASPELVISNNGVLEKRESELLKNETAHEANGFLYYTISLSVKPSGSVNVTVTKEGQDQVKCAKYEDGLIFNKTTYMFDPSNWNVSQKVEIDVRRKRTFQGTSVTRFKHKVNSEDSAWQSPFLRPMTISVTDDNECTNGAQKEDEFVKMPDGQGFTIRKCVCTKGHFVEATDPFYCNSVTSCIPCAEGMICTGKETLSKVLLAPGKYRMGLNSTIVVDCPVFEACTGTLSNLRNATAYVSSSRNSREIEFALRERLLNNAASSSDDLRNWGASLCRVGHQGAFCQVCTVAPNATYYWSDDTCQKCEGEKGNATIVFAVAGAGSFLLALLQLSGVTKKMKGRVLTSAEHLLPNISKWLESTYSRLKQGVENAKLQTKCEFCA
jgi:hypothetical protein